MDTHYQDYLTMLRVERNVSPQTIDAYTRDLKQYLGYINDQRVKDLSENEGIFAAPEGGATVAGLLKLIELGQINEKDKVLLLVTGSGFKYLDKLVPFFND